MTEYLFTNNAESTLEADIGGADTSFNVASGDGGLFPAVSTGSGQGFYIIVSDVTKSEWMLCTDRAGDTLTVTRGGSNSFDSGATVKLALNAAILSSFLQKGVFREVDSDPDGSLSANYAGEEVYQTVTGVWWKHCSGTLWKEMT